LFLDVLIDGFRLARAHGKRTVARLPREIRKVIPERAYAARSGLRGPKELVFIRVHSWLNILVAAMQRRVTICRHCVAKIVRTPHPHVTDRRWRGFVEETSGSGSGVFLAAPLEGGTREVLEAGMPPAGPVPLLQAASEFGSLLPFQTNRIER